MLIDRGEASPNLPDVFGMTAFGLLQEVLIEDNIDQKDLCNLYARLRSKQLDEQE